MCISCRYGARLISGEAMGHRIWARTWAEPPVEQKSEVFHRQFESHSLRQFRYLEYLPSRNLRWPARRDASGGRWLSVGPFRSRDLEPPESNRVRFPVRRLRSGFPQRSCSRKPSRQSVPMARSRSFSGAGVGDEHEANGPAAIPVGVFQRGGGPDKKSAIWQEVKERAQLCSMCQSGIGNRVTPNSKYSIEYSE